MLKEHGRGPPGQLFGYARPESPSLQKVRAYASMADRETMVNGVGGIGGLVTEFNHPWVSVNRSGPQGARKPCQSCFVMTPFKSSSSSLSSVLVPSIGMLEYRGWYRVAFHD